MTYTSFCCRLRAMWGYQHKDEYGIFTLIMLKVLSEFVWTGAVGPATAPFRRRTRGVLQLIRSKLLALWTILNWAYIQILAEVFGISLTKPDTGNTEPCLEDELNESDRAEMVFVIGEMMHEAIKGQGVALPANYTFDFRNLSLDLEEIYNWSSREGHLENMYTCRFYQAVIAIGLLCVVVNKSIKRRLRAEARAKIADAAALVADQPVPYESWVRLGKAIQLLINKFPDDDDPTLDPNGSGSKRRFWLGRIQELCKLFDIVNRQLSRKTTAYLGLESFLSFVLFGNSDYDIPPYTYRVRTKVNKRKYFLRKKDTGSICWNHAGYNKRDLPSNLFGLKWKPMTIGLSTTTTVNRDISEKFIGKTIWYDAWQNCHNPTNDLAVDKISRKLSQIKTKVNSLTSTAKEVIDRAKHTDSIEAKKLIQIAFGTEPYIAFPIDNTHGEEIETRSVLQDMLMDNKSHEQFEMRTHKWNTNRWRIPHVRGSTPIGHVDHPVGVNLDKKQSLGKKNLDNNKSSCKVVRLYALGFQAACPRRLQMALLLPPVAQW